MFSARAYRQVPLALTALLLMASAQSSSPGIELGDLDRLRREVALVREYAEGLQQTYSETSRVRFRYEEVILRLSVLESEIDEHIRYTNGFPRQEILSE